MPITIRKSIEQLTGIKGSVVSVGYPKETTGSEVYITDDGTDGLTLAANAITQIYGTDRIPPRDFMNAGQEDWRGNWVNGKAGYVFQQGVKQNNPKLFPEAVGFSLQGFIRKAFTGHSWEANSRMTIEQKGSSQPLIDSNKLRLGVDYIIRSIK